MVFHCGGAHGVCVWQLNLLLCCCEALILSQYNQFALAAEVQLHLSTSHTGGDAAADVGGSGCLDQRKDFPVLCFFGSTRLGESGPGADLTSGLW